MKEYQITFGGHIMSKIVIIDDHIIEVVAVDGYGNAMSKEDIQITELHDEPQS